MDDDRDVAFEAENNEAPGGADVERKVSKLKAEIEKLSAEKQEYLDGWQRSKADYVNALRRFEEEKKSAGKRGLRTAVEALLPAYDALERAKAHGEVPQGFEAIAKQLESAFKALGLKAVGEEGEKFDPAYHEALGQDPVDDKESDDTITAVLEKGYQFGDELLRPAKVRIGHFS